MDLDHPKSKWIQPTLDLIGWMLLAPRHSLHEIQTHWIGLDRKSWISKYPLDLSPLLWCLGSTSTVASPASSSWFV
jgi:hypothetical protein